MWLKIIILLLLHECNSQLHVFEKDYLGQYYSIEEFKKLDVCYSRICMRDAKNIAAKASHRNDSDPRLDFSEFACGHFNAYKPLGERYFHAGFIYDFELQINDFMRRVLREKIEEDEPKIIKVVKKYYQKCVDSTYVRTEGKAEFKSLLYEYGKFPIFENNWKPSDFNVTKALILEKEHLLAFSKEDDIIYVRFYGQEYVKKETVRNALKFEFNLSGELTSEISNDFFETFYAVSENLRSDDPVPIHKIDEFMNISSGLDWLEIIKHHTNNNNISNDTLISFKEAYLNNLKIFDLKNRRKLANIFTIRYLLPKLNYFAVYPVPNNRVRSKNRYEICIEDMRNYVNFPLEIMFQLKYGNETVSKAFKEFYEKFITIHLSCDRLINLTFIVGLPDELTSPEFLNKLYANLTLTGDEGIYKMSQQLKEYENFINQEGKNLIALENLSENAKEIFKIFREQSIYPYRMDKCEGPDNSIVVKVKNTLYPVFHPQRPYYVNLAYYSTYILIDIDLQKHYSKYVEKFGPEQNLPGFLMSNEQMLEMIKYQTGCYKSDYGYDSKYDVPKSIFNCPIVEEKEEEEEESWEDEFYRRFYPGILRRCNFKFPVSREPKFPGKNHPLAW